jgi:hypothetical protein
MEKKTTRTPVKENKEHQPSVERTRKRKREQSKVSISRPGPARKPSRTKQKAEMKKVVPPAKSISRLVPAAQPSKDQTIKQASKQARKKERIPSRDQDNPANPSKKTPDL